MASKLKLAADIAVLLGGVVAFGHLAYSMMYKHYPPGCEPTVKLVGRTPVFSEECQKKKVAPRADKIGQ